MKKRICFAGFGESEVDSLRPALASLGSGWECVFCADGTEALARLGKDAFAALVVDLRMDGMSGVGLLQLAVSDYPRTLRFALGELGDRESVANNIGAPHQFIARPWKLPELVSTIERSMALDSWLSSDKLRAFVPQLGRLPGLPSTYFEVLKRAESPNATVESIAEVIARDPALTARVLQTVNSAATAMGEKITNPADAVSVLGLDTVKSLVLCLQVFNQPTHGGSEGIPLDDLWRHSFSVAQTSRKIALLHSADARVASDAFTAGLLHRVGQILLTTNMSRDYATLVAAARENKRPLAEMELKRLGVTGPQVGAYLLGLWGMPLPLIEAAALYHNPGQATEREFSLLTAVHVANVLTEEEQPLVEGLPTPALDRKCLKELKLPETSDAWRKALAGGQFSEPAEKPRDKAEAARSGRPPRPHRSAAPAEESSRPSMGGIIVVAVLVVGGFLGWKWYSTRSASGGGSSSAVAPAQTQSPANTGGEPPSSPAPTSSSPAPPVAPDDSMFASFQISAILYSPSRPVAHINGKDVLVGDKINGAQVVAITQTNVVFSFQGRQHTVKWK